MIVELIPHDPPRRDLNASYKLRSRFWLTSVCAHIMWVAAAVQIPLSAPASKRPIYDQFIRPLETKVLIYRPPKKVEDASPEEQVGKSPDPRGKLTAPRTVIATAKNAQSQKQFIWKPVKLPEVQVDVPAPTVVARVETALPPPPPKLAPKEFVPPTVAKSDPKLPNAEITTTINTSLTVTQTLAATPASRASLPPPPKVTPKQFVPPPPSEREPRLAIQTQVDDSVVLPTALVMAQNGAAAPTSNLPPPPKVAPKQFKAPPSSGAPKQNRTDVAEALASAARVDPGPVDVATPSLAFARVPGPARDLPPAPVPNRGNEQANIAVASVNPAPAAQLPTSSRSGEFSVAPKYGEAASGAASPGALTVPNLAVREPAALPKPAPAKSNTLVYAERVRPSFSSVFTVPLRPANRSLPRTVEPHLVGRSVYAVVIPIENLPAYGTDWILWFAEISPPSGPAPSVRPPVPTRKLELVEKGREPADTRLQISATLSSDGKLRNLKVLSAVSEAIQDLAIEDLSSWEWKPATRNNVAVAIEAVFEIPFRLGVRP